MRKIKFFSVLALTIAVILVIAAVAHAAAAYHGSWSTRPLWGNWWWYNNSPSSSRLTWYVDDCWSSDGVNALRKYHGFPYYYEFRFEQEAYNPGAGTNCDRLGVYSAEAMDLPITSRSILNGCGGSTVKELVHWNLDENKITSGIWYRHRVIYDKYNPGTGGDGEVNYSWTRNLSPSDDWLGKVVYDQWFNKKSSDPAGLVN